MLFHLKIKIKAIFPKVTLTLCSAAPCLFCFEAICDRYFFKRNCFKLIGWFNHHNVFPPIRSVSYRFLLFDYRKLHCDYKKLHCDYRKLRCDYRKLHCDYRKLHCCLWLTALKSTNHSRVISLCILLYILSSYNMLYLALKKSIFPFKNIGVTCSNMSRTIVKSSNFSVPCSVTWCNMM
jgi:hypothetical protein